jgi:hypothetical protein
VNNTGIETENGEKGGGDIEGMGGEDRERKIRFYQGGARLNGLFFIPFRLFSR